jgi:hypothetical protein
MGRARLRTEPFFLFQSSARPAPLATEHRRTAYRTATDVNRPRSPRGWGLRDKRERREGLATPRRCCDHRRARRTGEIRQERTNPHGRSASH